MKERNGSNLIAKAEIRSQSLKVSETLRRLIYLIPSWAGISLMISSIFGSLTVSWWVLFIFGMALSALILAVSATKNGGWTIPVLLAVVVISGIVFYNTALDGIRKLVNDIFVYLPSATGRIFLDYEVSSEKVIPALIIIMLLLAIMLTASVKNGSWIPVLPLIILWAAGTAFRVIPISIGWALFAVGMILIKGCGEDITLGSILQRVIAVAIAAILALGLGTALGDADMKGLRETAGQSIHSLIYDNSLNSMPEGRIANLGPWSKSDTPALSVTMDEPQKLYLRGHIYEVYTGTSWEEVSNEELAENEALFYWLHKRDFHGQSQIAQAMSLAGAEDINRLEVKNISACSQKGYAPYALIDTGLLDDRELGDVGTDRQITEMSLYPGSVREWYEAQRAISDDQKNEEKAEYLRSEQSYAAYIKEHDLQLTQESWNAMYRQLGDSSGARSLHEIQAIIRKYLDGALHYDEKVYTTSGRSDFLHYVLEQSNGRGYSVQYATAATLLLRYYGVPARYVEGYYLSPEQAADAEKGKEIVLTEENAHAWAEYYLNGVGFVPFEVTPGYIDPEDLDPETGAEGNTGGMNTYVSNSMSYIQTEEPDTKEQELLPESPMGPVTISLILLGILFIAAAAFIISRRVRLNRKLKEIDESSDREAVAMRYGYAMALKERADEIVLPEDEEAARLNELAIFSSHEITKDDRYQMNDYADKVLNECKDKWRFLKKIKLRLFEGIY